MRKALGVVLLVGAAAAVGVVVYRAVQARQAEQALWTEATLDAYSPQPAYAADLS
jgi:uncharacterized membrane protein YebE (DUF533 family)